MRLQVAFDYLMVFTFVLLVFTILFASIAKQSIEFSSEQSFSQLQVAAQTIASEISDAGQGGNGFIATYSLPAELSILQYNLSLTKYGTVIVTSTQFGQNVTAVAFGGQYNILSNQSYLTKNTFYRIPTYNSIGSITFQNDLGTICVDVSCLSSLNKVSQLTVSQSTTGSVALNGQNSYLSYGNSGVFNDNYPFSMSVWFMPLGPLSSSSDYSIASNGGTSGDWTLQLNGNTLYVYLCTTVSCISTSDPNKISYTKWYNAVFTYNGVDLALYVDGAPVNLGAATGNLAFNANSFCFGNSCASGQTNFFQGQIANAQFYTSTLTSTQVQSLYAGGIGGLPVNTATLGFWSLLNGNLNDLSGNGYNGQSEGPLSYPTVADITATASNSTGNTITGALIGFSSTTGFYVNGPTTSNLTNSNGIASVFLNQTGPSAVATVQVTPFNGNSSETGNLIAWFPLNLGQGSQIGDTSELSATQFASNYLTGSITDASWSSPNYVALFDGQSSYIQIPANAALQKSTLTINSWVNVSGTGSSHFSWIVGRYGAYGVGICGKSLQLCYYDYGGTGEHDSIASLMPSVWYMVTAVISAGKETIYVNGANVLSGPLTIASQSNTFQIGGVALPFPGNTPSQFFNGSASNIQLYSSALTQNQINSLYSVGFAGSPLSTSLLAWWPLNGNAYDFSGNRYNGTIYGNLRMVTPSGIGGQFGPSHMLYASFNGVNSYVQASNITSFNTPTNTMTISGWVKYAAGEPSSIGWLAVRVNAYGLGACGTTLTVCYYNWGAPAGTGTKLSNAMLTPNTWYMMTAVINNPANSLASANTETIYLNGVEVLSGALSLASTANALDIGACASCNQYLDGGISNLQAYGSALTQSQIEQLYQQGISATPLLNSQIISWFPLDGNTNDYSNPQNQAAGIASNIVYYAQNTNPPTWTPELSGYGLYFNGADGNILINNNLQLSSSNGLTVSAWIYPVSSNSVGGSETLVSDWSTSGLGTGPFMLYLSANPANPQMMYLKSKSYVSGSLVSVSSSGATISPNSWYQAILVYNGTDENLYINGVKVGNTLKSGFISSSSGNTMTVGYSPVSPYNYFNGTIADIEVYNNGLTSQQVSQLYNAGLPITETVTVPMGGTV